MTAWPIRKGKHGGGHLSTALTESGDMQQNPARADPTIPILAFGAIVAVLLLIALTVYQGMRDDRRAVAEGEMKAVAELKIGQIESWLAERYGDASFVAGGSRFANHFQRWLQEPGHNTESLDIIRFGVALLKQSYGYDTVALFDTQGNEHPLGDAPTSAGMHRGEVLEALRQGKPLLVDFHRHDGEHVQLGLVAPLNGSDSNGGKAVGAIYLGIDAEHGLLPMLRRWPLPSRTGETVLARRDGEKILFMVTAKLPPMSISFSVDEPSLPVARAARGESGILRNAHDYVGAPVLAYAARVPGTPWILVAKQDQDEVDAPLEETARWVAFVTLLLLGSTAAIFWFWWRGQENRYRGRILKQQLEQTLTSRQAREELEASEQKYRILADYSSDWEFWIGADGSFRYVSPACEEVCGYSPEDFYADPGLMARIVHPDDAAVWSKHMSAPQEAYQSGHTPKIFRILSKQGAERWIEHVCTSVFDAEGRYLGHRGNNRDITERKRGEAILYASEEVNRITFEQAAVGIAHIGIDGSWIRVNDKLCEIIGYPKEELLELTLQDVTHPADLGADATSMERMLAGLDPSRAMEKRSIRKDGSTVWINLTYSLLRDASGEPRHFIAFVEDISARKQLEQEHAQHQNRLEEEVRRRTRELYRRTEELEIANTDLESFSYSVSHDLRAPLRAIDGFATIIQEDYGSRLDEEGRRLFSVVRNNARKMSTLIDDILALSRAGRMELTHVEVDMNALVDEVWASLAEPRSLRNIDFHREDLPSIRCDPRAIRQVWSNLLGNAVKFTRDRDPARIEVFAEDRGGSVDYAVKDNGVGFKAEHADKLFSLFQRLHGMEEFEGTGVGLAIVKRFVRKHGGQVEATASAGIGAIFHFSLPKIGIDAFSEAAEASYQAGQEEEEDPSGRQEVESA